MRGLRLYIQLSDQQLRVSAPEIERTLELDPQVAVEAGPCGERIVAIGREAEALARQPGVTLRNPFAHPRVVIDGFGTAETLVLFAVKTLLRRPWWGSVALGILHPQGELQGGLSDIERRALEELGLGAGCRRAVVHLGAGLAAEEVLSYPPDGLRR